jgi:hypothetical protein
MPSVAAINADEAIAALDAGTAAGFHFNYRPGGDPYFYLALANGTNHHREQPNRPLDPHPTTTSARLRA